MCYSWTNEGDFIKASNTVKLAYEEALGDMLPKILNMGCQFAAIGQIHWLGDAFVITNANQGVCVSGQLSRDNNGRASTLLVNPHSLRPHGENIVPTRYDYGYNNGNSASPQYLPASIAETFTEKDGTPFTLDYKILTLEVTNQALDALAFLPDPRVEPDLAYVAISNDFRILPGGYVVPDIGRVAVSHAKLAKYYFVLLTVIMVLPPIVYLTIRIKRFNQNKK
jgi:hypothetical protein